MILPGTRRIELDKRDLSFHRSFGTVPMNLALVSYNYDAGKTMPDQNADGLPYGCTGYTTSEIAGDEDDAIYKPLYTYQKTCSIEGHGTDQGCDIRTALKTGQVYGVQRLDEQTDQEAEQHRRGKYYNVDLVQGCDWFDSFRLALRTGKRPISIGTIWFREWLTTGQDGVLTSQFVFNGKPDQYNWHNYKICGEQLIQAEPYLIAKTWQGKNFGDNGWCYFSRETFNKAFDMYGTAAFIQPPYSPQDAFTVKLSMFQFVLTLIARMIHIKIYA